MIRATSLMVILLLALSVAGQGQDKKKVSGRLPTGWSKVLKLDKAQADKIRAIDVKARMEIDKLSEQIRQVRLKSKQEQLAVLTPEQRKTLREALVGKEEKEVKDSGKKKDGGKDK